MQEARDGALYGFDGSTFVRTVRTVLDVKGIDYGHVPVNVLEGNRVSPNILRVPVRQGAGA